MSILYGRRGWRGRRYCVPYPQVNLLGTQAAGGGPGWTPLVQGQIFNPYTTTIVGGQQVRNPFPNNIDSLELQDPVALAIQKMLPSSERSPATLTTTTSPAYTSFQHTTNFSVKLDQSLSSTIKISGYYSQLNTFSPNVNGGITPVVSRRRRHQQLEPHRPVELRPDHHPDSASPRRHWLFPHLGAARCPAFRSEHSWAEGLSGQQDYARYQRHIGRRRAVTRAAVGAVGSTFSATAYEEKPTANTSLTWIRGNHTFKAGGDYTQEGYPTPSLWRANGNFTFNAAETSDPWQSTVALSSANPTGFSYASFLMGLPDVLQLNAPTDTKLGYHSLGFFIQDSWKVTPEADPGYRPALGLPDLYERTVRAHAGRIFQHSGHQPRP